MISRLDAEKTQSSKPGINLVEAGLTEQVLDTAAVFLRAGIGGRSIRLIAGKYPA